MRFYFMSNVEKNKSGHIFYLDALRCLAILAVIIFNVAVILKPQIIDTYTSTLNIRWLFGDFLYAGLVMGVDLFLMLSGALSLGREWSIISFFKRRLPRIGLPFVFWGLVLGTLMLLIQLYWPNMIHVVNSFDFKDISNFFIGVFMNKSFGFQQYWLFWMTLGIYLIMPIFNKWLLNADLKEAEYFLVIWLVTCFFVSTLKLELPIKLDYFVGPIGMVILGYYLRYTKRKIFDNKWLPILLIAISLACIIYTSFIHSTPNKLYNCDRYSLFNVAKVAGIFLLFRNFSGFTFNNDSLSKFGGILRKPIISIAVYSYGFYLLNQPILNIIVSIFKHNHLFVGYGSLFFKLFFATLFVCWIIMAVLDRIPYVNQLIGSK